MTASRPPETTSTLPGLDSTAEQAQRLIDLGVAATAGIAPADLRAAAAAAPEQSLLVIRPDLAPVSTLAPLLVRNGKPGFVVVDMPDVDQFAPLADLDQPESPVYALQQLSRGDELRNWSPDEALPVLTDAGRTPLTLAEGVHWLLQQPEILVENHCFMTIGSRLRKPNGRLDSRTPALWISGGTGRDGKERKGAAKVGWCWAGNRHTWLGFGSAGSRAPLPPHGHGTSPDRATQP